MRLFPLLLATSLSTGCVFDAPDPGPTPPTRGMLAVLVRTVPRQPVVVNDTTYTPHERIDDIVGQVLEQDTFPSTMLAATRLLRVHYATRLHIDSLDIAASGGHLYRTRDSARTREMGYLGIAGVGLSPDSSVAVILWAFGCGDLCGGQGLSVLRRDSLDVWHEERYISIGAS